MSILAESRPGMSIRARALAEAQRPITPAGSITPARSITAAARCLERWARAGVADSTLTLVLPAPRIDPASDPGALFGLLPPGQSSSPGQSPSPGQLPSSSLASGWRRGSEVWVGIGAAHRLTASGPRRFTRLRTELRRLAGRWLLAGPTAVEGDVRASGSLLPRFFGGFAFDPNRSAARPGKGEGDGIDDWRGFADGDFVLPRWTCRLAPGSAHLLLTVTHADAGHEHGRRRALAELETVLGALGQASVPSSSLVAGPGALDLHFAPQPGARDVELGSGLEAKVERALERIDQGDFRKVVLARAVRRCSDRPLDLEGLARTWLAAHGATESEHGTRFAFRRGADDSAAWFLGATPERLVELRGTRVRSEALAGTCGSGSAEAASFFDDPKERGEHAWVVEAITGALGPFCEPLEVPDRPEILHLPRLMHLRTPIEGQLRRPTHVLDLVAALHPTPAVGGWPAPAALRWQGEHEGLDRGWYAGPVGWMDPLGNGDFAVALRCGLLRGDSKASAGARTTLRTFAGAGIVAGSVPARERREIELKQRSFLSALDGASP